MTTADPPLTPDELAAYRTLDASALFFARAEIEGFISEDYTGPEIRCMYPELGPVVGYAVTSEWTTTDPESPDLDFLDYYDWITTLPTPRIAVMKDVDPRVGRAAALGNMQARTLQRLGVEGIVSSVALQKPGPVRAVGMPVWATGIAAAHGPYHIVRYGAPVEVGRVSWRTGDLVFADAAGAIRIPVELARRVLAKALESDDEHPSYFDVIEDPDFTVARLREWIAGHPSIYPPVDPAAKERWWAANGGGLAPRDSGVRE
jgi:regulator of RNase E activity RraA